MIGNQMEAPSLAPDAIARPARPQRSRHIEFSERRLLLILGDLLALNAALAAVTFLRFDDDFARLRVELWFAVLTLLWVLVSSVAEAYDLRAAARARTSVYSVLRAGVATVVLYVAIPVISAPLPTSRLAALGFGVLALALLAAWRVAYARLVWQPQFETRALVVGAGWAGRTIVEAIREHGASAYHLVGFIDFDPAKRRDLVAGLPVLGDSSRLRQFVRENAVDEIVLAVTGDMRDELHGALREAFDLGVRLTPMTDLYETLTSRLPVEHVGDRWYAHIPTTAEPGLIYALCRRAVDLAFGLVGTLGFAVALPFVALAIRLDSSGPIFYSQERVGRRGRSFQITKFRSMIRDAERGGAVWAVKGDSRVTRVGRVLRKTRLDELPQFVCILQGDMSLIGPRPERPGFVDQLAEKIPFYRARLLVKPGLTGWAQVMHGYGSTVEDALMKLQYDLYYIKHQSLFIDMLIVLKTVGIVLRCKGT